MTAIEIAGFGGPEVLTPAERPVPRPGKGEVLIEVAAAGVNRPDVLQRQGGYKPPPGASDIPGLEVAGRVVGAGRRGVGLEGGRSGDAPWSPAAAMPNTAPPRRRNACRSPRGWT